MKNLVISQKSNTLYLIAGIIASVLILGIRAARIIAGTAKVVYTWLVTKHTYFAQEGAEESITMTGIQYVGVGILTSVVCVLLSIQW